MPLSSSPNLALGIALGSQIGGGRLRESEQLEKGWLVCLRVCVYVCMCKVRVLDLTLLLVGCTCCGTSYCMLKTLSY